MLLSSFSTEYKVNTVLLLGPSQPMKESTTQTMNTIYESTPPCLDSLSHSPLLIRSPRSQTPRLPFCGRHFAVTAVLFIFWAAGLQVISRTPDTSSVPLTLQSLQFSRVIYGARRAHPPCLPLSAFMMLDSCRGPSHLCLSPPLRGEHGTFSVRHNPITPLRPCGEAIRAVWPVSGLAPSFL